MNLSQITRAASCGLLAAAIILILSLPTRGGTWFEPAPNPFVPQCDPGDEDYVLDTFTLGPNSMDVLVTKTAKHPFAAGKEYWSVNSGILTALARATEGATMTLSGAARRWPAPDRFDSTFRMQDPVTWRSLAAPRGGAMWVYHDMAADTYVGIRFNLTGPADDPSVRAIEWFISEKTPPRTGTYVFAPGATYSLTYGAPPELPDGQRWFAVTVQPGT